MDQNFQSDNLSVSGYKMQNGQSIHQNDNHDNQNINHIENFQIDNNQNMFSNESTIRHNETATQRKDDSML